MPPGMTMCRVASTTRLADSTASVPGAASAAMVSPATATSQVTTPCGVTTSPPRMMRSSIMPPDAARLSRHKQTQRILRRAPVNASTAGHDSSSARRAQPDKLENRLAQQLGLVAADRVAAVLEDAQLRALDDAMNFLGEFRRADPVVATAENERRRGDGG